MPGFYRPGIQEVLILMKPELSVLTGGRKRPANRSIKNYRYVAGFATDTRLMGVIGMELTWTFFDQVNSSENEPVLFRQIFYLDCEDRFIDTYYESYGPDDAALRKERNRLVASLGGSFVPVSEKEARFLIQSYSGITGSSIRLPEGGSSYTFLLFPEQTLTQSEYDALASRICGEIATPYFAVNYYLMRCASLDERGIAYMQGSVRFPDPDRIHPSDQPISLQDRLFDKSATLYQNTIRHSHENADLYQSEALTERSDGAYFITNCSLTISDKPLLVSHAEAVSEFRITDIEAAMILKHPEFISICVLSAEDAYFRSSFSSFTAYFTETAYESGRLYVKYRNHNGHAGNRVFRLNDDVEAAYFLTDTLQIIVMGYTSEEASLAEFNLIAALLHCDIYTENRYEFPEPVLYEFMNSGIDDFNEFLDFITDDGED